MNLDTIRNQVEKVFPKKEVYRIIKPYEAGDHPPEMTKKEYHLQIDQEYENRKPGDKWYRILPPEDGGQTYTRESFLAIQEAIIENTLPGCEVLDPLTGHFKRDDSGELVVCDRNEYDSERWNSHKIES